MSRTEPVQRALHNEISKKTEQRYPFQVRLPPHPARTSPMPKTMELLLRPAPEHVNSFPPRIEVAHQPFVEP